MNSPINRPKNTVYSGRAFSAHLNWSLKTEHTMLRAQNLRGREASDIGDDARMVSEIPERSTEP